MRPITVTCSFSSLLALLISGCYESHTTGFRDPPPEVWISVSDGSALTGQRAYLEVSPVEETVILVVTGWNESFGWEANAHVAKQDAVRGSVSIPVLPYWAPDDATAAVSGGPEVVPKRGQRLERSAPHSDTGGYLDGST